MHSGQGRSLTWAGLLASALGLLAGCVAPRTQIDQGVIANRLSPHHGREITDGYHARCPDVLRVDIAGLPQFSGQQRIGADGRINLGDAGRPRVDGETAPEIIRTVAEVVRVSPEQVQVEVVEYSSQYLYLFGEVAGLQRAVPYQGPETVLDLLHRVGGLTPGAAPRDIRIVRPHIADGKTPEVFHIDLAAIILRNDPETNINLEPYDQVHIGQSRRSYIGSCLPPWLRPIYDRLCGMKRQ
jgi:protein involved in polysaccharide export with SLBB domain